MTEPVEFIRASGDREWRLPDGKLHRDDGPAYIAPNDSQFWFQHHQRHRLDGPAVVRADGTEDWWVNNQHITDQIKAWIRHNDLSSWTEWDDNIWVLFRIKFS